MSLSHQQIIALLQIKGCGIKSARKIGDYAQHIQPTETPEDFLTLISYCIRYHICSPLPYINLEHVKEALDKAQDIQHASQKAEIGILSRYDDQFPNSLKTVINRNGIDVSPILLYYKGNPDILSLPTMAIIGTREPSPEALLASEYYGYYYANRGFNIISGLAKGCDASAHRGALKSNIGKTCAILAHGLDSIYPEENRQLAASILDRGGLLLSEYPIYTPLEKYYLVARDRLQAGLAQAIIIIQTSSSGGTMHAAYGALAARKPLFCAEFKDKDLMNSNQLKGNKILLKEGGKPLSTTNLEQVIESINYMKSIQEYTQGELF